MSGAPSDRCFISCAITGGMTVPGQSDAIPVTPDEIVESALEAHAAGAAIVHLHVRDPGSGRPSSDLALFEDVIGRIRERSGAIVQPTTGGGVGMTIDERARVVTSCRPEVATFNVGSFNFGIFHARRRPSMEPWELDYLDSTRDYVFRNTFGDMERLAELFREAGTKPEYECYDVGHLYNLRHLADRRARRLSDPPAARARGARRERRDDRAARAHAVDGRRAVRRVTATPGPRPGSGIPRSSTWRRRR